MPEPDSVHIDPQPAVDVDAIEARYLNRRCQWDWRVIRRDVSALLSENERLRAGVPALLTQLADTKELLALAREIALSSEHVLAYKLSEKDVEIERLRGERDVALTQLAATREALRTLERWDMLSLDWHGRGNATADAPWARKLIAGALEVGDDSTP